MPQGLKRTNKANNIIFDSVWSEGVNHDGTNFEDDQYEEEEDTENKYNYVNDYEYDEMEKNRLVDILQEPNHFQVPHETEQEQRIAFEEK